MVTFSRLFPLHAHRGLAYTLIPDIGGLQDYEFFLGPTLSHFGQEVCVTVVLCTIYLFVVYRVWRRDDEEVACGSSRLPYGGVCFLIFPPSVSPLDAFLASI